MKKHNQLSRRDFIKLSGAAAAGVMVFGCSDDGNEDDSLDILLKNGKAFLHDQFISCDIGIRNHCIAKIDTGLGLNPTSKTQIIDCSGMYISPGWADLHVHLGSIGVDIERIGPATGVTALADAGTYGPLTFDSFMQNFRQNTYQMPVYSFLNLRKDGISYDNILVSHDESLNDPVGVENLVAQYYPGIIKGLKCRADKNNTQSSDRIMMVRKTAEIGESLGIPVMYHISDPPPSLLDILPYTKSGDIITHFARKNDSSILNFDGQIHPEVLNAKNNGVLFDIGHGVGSYVFDTAHRLKDLSFTDFTISSDLYFISSTSRAITFANVLSKFLMAGFSLEEIVERASSRPLQWLGLDSEIKEGLSTNLTIFSLMEGSFAYQDCVDVIMNYHQRIIPEYSILNGQVIRAGDIDRELFLS